MELKELITILKDVLSQQQLLIVVVLYFFYRWIIKPFKTWGTMLKDIIEKYLEIQEKQVGGIWRLCDKVDALIDVFSRWERSNEELKG